MSYPPANNPAYPGPGAPGGPPPQAWGPNQGGAPHQWDNLPSKPMADNPNCGPPQFQPPPIEDFQSFNGYEGMGGFGQMAPMPPPPPPPPPQGDSPLMQFDSVANLSEDACRDAMVQFVSEKCCYGKKPAEEMKINKICPASALHYILETYGETRDTGYIYEPYSGGPIDGPHNGMPPPPWAIPCVPDVMFNDQTKLMEVPHTAVVKTCHHCCGMGFDRCYRCHGMGWLSCSSCGGDGNKMVADADGNSQQQPCGMCGGDGRRHCHTCGGDGRITCGLCKGYRQLKCFIQLSVKFSNHKEDHIMEKTDMPDELVRDVGGITIFEQVLPQVWPIIAYPIQEINQNSVRLVEKHRGAFTSERQLQQRQQLRAVPVTEVSYTWDDVNTRFWVYGKEKKVHSPDYPQQCCCGCTIL